MVKIMSDSSGKKPLVSILVVTYQQEAYIRQTLESILTQKCSFPFEILIGDDASTDGTSAICLEFAKNYPDRVRLHIRNPNLGFLNNYFDLFKRAKGKYLADCGGDDYWLDDTRLQQQVDFLEAHPEAGMIAGNWLILDETTGRSHQAATIPENGWWQPDFCGKEAVKAYIQNTSIPKILLASACFRADWSKEAFNTNPAIFIEEYATCEDLPLTLSILMKGSIYIRPDIWAVYRKRKNSISHSEDPEKWIRDFSFKTFRHTLQIAQHFGLKPKDLRKYVRQHSNDFALHAFLQNRPDFYESLTKTLHEGNHKSAWKYGMYGWFMRNPALGNWFRTFQLFRKEIKKNQHGTT
jgi:glycosyltransferase involved in cell wall biosynthesis